MACFSAFIFIIFLKTMPRKKEFDVDLVLDKAMNAFWNRGYEATSLNDLLDCMQIQRASLYNAFGDKRTLFLETLRRYEVNRQAQISSSAKLHSPRQAIFRLFQDIVTAVLENKAREGCFLVNTALELSPHDEKVAKFVGRAFSKREMFFRKMIEKGQASGEISQIVAPAATARALLSLCIGLRVLSRSRPEKLLLESIAKQVDALLPSGDEAVPTLDSADASSSQWPMTSSRPVQTP